MRVLLKQHSPPHQCPYLRDRQATMEYQYVSSLSGAEYETLMNRGYRKFGPVVFRPDCQGCSECRPIRIPVAEFRPDRSQRRAWKANEHLRVEYAAPTCNDVRMSLYERYHDAQTIRKGWPVRLADEEEYSFSHVTNPLQGVEISLWEGEALRAIVLCDLTPNTVSGVYHYYDPDLYPQGIGTACMLHTIELARRLEKRWAYFGFFVEGCESMAYKSRFRPFELMGIDGVWQPVAPGSPIG